MLMNTNILPCGGVTDEYSGLERREEDVRQQEDERRQEERSQENETYISNS